MKIDCHTLLASIVITYFSQNPALFFPRIFGSPEFSILSADLAVYLISPHNDVSKNSPLDCQIDGGSKGGQDLSENGGGVK